MALDYFKAKEAGYSDEEIAQYLAEESNLDYNKAVQAGYKPIEIIGGLGYNMDVDKPAGTSDTILRQLERGVTGVYRFGKQVFGKNPALSEQPEDSILPLGLPSTPDKAFRGLWGVAENEDNRKSDRLIDEQKELEARIQLETNPWVAYPARIAGSIADPGTWIPVGRIATAAQGAKQFALQGAIGGALEPVYGNDSRLMNIATGTALGIPIGATVGKIINKFGKVVDDVAGEADPNIPVPSTKGIDDALNQPIIPKQEAPIDVPKVEAPPVATAADELAPPPLATPPITPIANAIDPYTATLPTGLSKAAPRYGRDVTGFNSDLDRALYIIRDSKGKRSDADAAYLNWVRKVTGIQDEATLRGLGDDVLAHMKDIPDVANIPPSNLAALRPQQAAPQATYVPEIVKPTAPYQGSEGIKLSNVIDPTSNAWKVLDNPSKNLYNIGKRLLESDTTGTKIKLTPVERTEAESFIRGIDPSLNELQRGEVVRSYAKVLDDLYSTKGADFQPPSLAQLMKQGIDDADMAELMAKGVFDGCDL